MNGFETIAFWEIDRYKNDKNCIIIDLRNKELYRQAHVEGAWNIPYDHLEEALPMLPREKTLLFYCERGGTAMAAARELSGKGYSVKAAVGGFEH